MNFNSELIYPNWGTKACVITSNVPNTYKEYALFSYNTCICIYRISVDSSQMLAFNIDDYPHSRTTIKHFIWFLHTFIRNPMYTQVRKKMDEYKSYKAFLEDVSSSCKKSTFYTCIN